MTSKDLSIIIPWYDLDILAFTLKANRVAFNTSGCPLYIANCGGNYKRVNDFLQKGLLKATILNIDHKFNKSLALNLAVSTVTTPFLTIIDADVIITETYLPQVVSSLRSSRCFTTAASVLDFDTVVGERLPDFGVSVSRECYMHFGLPNGEQISVRTSNTDLLNGTRAGPGLLGARKADLELIGGYNSGLSFWGWEDLDVQLRLQHVLKIVKEEVGTVHHCYHSDDDRNLKSLSKQEANQQNLTSCLKRYGEGVFHGSYVSDLVNTTFTLISNDYRV